MHSKDNDSKIPYVIFHQNWNPIDNIDSKNINKLRDEGTIKIIENINIDTEEGKLFCPSCGYPCTRSPRKKSFSKDGRKAYLKHQSNSSRPDCNLSKYEGEGERYDNEEKCSKAVASGKLSIIRQWREEPSEREWINQEASLYNGTIEDKNGKLANRSISRHISFELEKPNNITTLDYITRNIDKFMYQDIILPNSSVPESFSDIFIHFTKATSKLLEANIERIYWGEVKHVEKVGNFIRIAFGCEKHCVDFAISTKLKKYTVEYLAGKYIAIAGKLERSHSQSQDNENQLGQARPCWRVATDKWGAVGIIKIESLILLSINEFQWVDPILLSGIDGRSITRYLIQQGWNPSQPHPSRTELKHPDSPTKIALATKTDDPETFTLIQQAIQKIATAENCTPSQSINKIKSLISSALDI
jgi:uncharacterized Zn finger protein (UPF0148 family)